MKNKLPMKLIERVKLHLAKNYGLNMLRGDVRFAYLIYYVYANEFHDLITLRGLINGAFEMLSENGISVSYVAFERSCYSVLKRIADKGKYLEKVFEVAKEIDE